MFYTVGKYLRYILKSVLNNVGTTVFLDEMNYLAGGI